MNVDELLNTVTRDVSRTFFVFGGAAGLVVGAAASLLIQGFVS
ncbi:MULTISPECIES: hypothetical protein [unclassified Stenotrophomonas]